MSSCQQTIEASVVERTTAEKATNEVRQQYEAYPFPMVAPQQEMSRLVVTPQDTLAKISHYCFQGSQDFSNGFRVLVAGGGTGHALIYLAEQLRNTDAEVFYLDLSESSMRTAKERARHRGLDNITWHRGSITDIDPQVLGQFDYINCTGVLHHLPDPSAGLRSLMSVLKPTGAMGLMVYGKYGRTGVYQIQELMRQINEEDSNQAQKVSNTKRVLQSLPPSHWQMRGRDRKTFLDMHLADDSDLYDLFLHSQDCAYSVPEVYDFVENEGLKLNAFTHFQDDPNELLKYQPSTFLEDLSLLKRVRSMPLRKQYAIAELMGTDISLHTFYVSFREDSEASPDELNNVPFLIQAQNPNGPIFSSCTLPEYGQWMEDNPGQPLNLRHPAAVGVALPPTRYIPAILKAMNGINSFSEIIQQVEASFTALRQPFESAAIRNDAKRIYQALHEIGWMFLKQKGIHIP